MPNEKKNLEEILNSNLQILSDTDETQGKSSKYGHGAITINCTECSRIRSSITEAVPYWIMWYVQTLHITTWVVGHVTWLPHHVTSTRPWPQFKS